jgi:hypothetical protein
VNMRHGQVISPNASGPGCIIQSDFGDGEHGNFEVVVLEGGNLVHYWHDNSDANLPWRQGQVISPNASGPGCIIQSDFGDGEHGNFEVVLTQGRELWHWWHDNSNVNLPWQPGQMITVPVSSGACIIQSDFRGDEHGNFEVVVLEENNLVHHWHDNSDVNLPWRRGQTIAHSSMYVFFTTDRIEDPGTDNNSMGRTVLARSEDGGIRFGPPLYDLSTDKFINLSLQVVENAQYPGLPDREGQGLLLWGSGGYRRSNVYLAYLPLARLEDRSSVRYFAGMASGGPRWVIEEARAQPLFLSGSVGELCVRWNPFLRRFILLYNGGNPGFVLEHQSPLPWGPWSGAQNIFDFAGALRNYIHEANSSDGLSDAGQEEHGGAIYGPYLIGPYTTSNNDTSTTMYFVLSTHNPYNTMLMKTTIRLRD